MAAVASAGTGARPAKGGTSLVVQLAVILLLTLAAAAAGWFSGASLGSSSAPRPTDGSGKAEPAKPEAAGTSEASRHGGDNDEDTAPVLRPGVVQLQPITTNLAAPSAVWIRLEIAVVFDGDTDAGIADQIHQDLMAYVRTLSLPQIEGASGFRHLRADLEDRAAIRSGGRVRKILIRTLLFE